MRDNGWTKNTGPFLNRLESPVTLYTPLIVARMTSPDDAISVNIEKWTIQNPLVFKIVKVWVILFDLNKITLWLGYQY